MRARTVLSLVVWMMLPACGKPTEVELRLFPCMFDGAPPGHVDLEIQGYDAGGMALPPLHGSYPVPMGALADGYATVGLRKPAGMVSADFTLMWHGPEGRVEEVVLTAVKVPDVGEVIELGGEGCAPAGETTTGSSSGASTGESTSTSGATGTGESSTGPSTTGGTSTGMSTGEGTTTTTTGTSTTTTGETTTTTGETGDTTGMTTGTTLSGMDCDAGSEFFFCDGGGPGQLGQLFECVGDVWTAKDCSTGFYCDFLVDPIAVGCSGIGGGSTEYSCVCRTEVECGDPMEAGCDDNEIVTLCIQMGDKLYKVQGQCTVCDDTDPDNPYCVAG